MVHRGPDGEGKFVNDHVAMGMRRLSIIDLEGGWQPIYNEDRTIALIANGEIYNYVELTRTLENKHTFSTHSDCEPIIHLYEEYGADCVNYLRGMFAFTLYDMKKQIVLIARDRMGEKPLYYHQGNDFLLFASEMKSLLKSGLINFELDPASVNDFFHYQYVPEPKTPLKNVHKLPAGHYMLVDLKAWSFQNTTYWKMEDASPVEGDPVSLIREELNNISDIVIRSDVPVGLALSGGLDSSAIAALTVKKYPGIMHAFSVGYPGRPANDERSDAKKFAEYLKIPLHEIELETDDFVDYFDELNFMRDDPIADISGYGYYAVSREARNNGVPVLLQGQGGDELFWGYPWVRDAVLKTDDLLHNISPFRRLVDALINNKSSLNLRSIRDIVKQFMNSRRVQNNFNHDLSRNKYRPVFHEMLTDFQVALTGMKEYYTPAFMEKLGDASAFDFFTFSSPWEYTDIRITRLICETYLMENGIAQGDRLSMANSVELRLPLVDYKLVELIIGLRKANRDNPDYEQFPKPWLRGAVEDIVPDWVINRPKQGFAPPVIQWHNEIFTKYGHYLKDGFLVQSEVLTQEAGEALSSGPFPSGVTAPVSFKALVLEIWCRKMRELIN